ncbi:hypothetical protein GGI12_005582, partial [Dipsacomyces acuminosporus]
QLGSADNTISHQKRGSAGTVAKYGFEFITKFFEKGGSIKHPGWNPSKNPAYGSGGTTRRRI